MDIVDVVVVGARCAGSATALLLARGGLRVLAVERSAAGSDTISGHMIKPDGVARLAVWGVLPDLLASGCPPIAGAEVVLHGRSEAHPAPAAGTPQPLAPRRTVLDRLLQEHARRAGAEVHCGIAFRGLHNGVVILGDGRRVRARLLVGADGRHSAVARAVGAGFEARRPGRSCAWFGYWADADLPGLRAELGPGVFAGAFPTHDHAVLAFVQRPVAAWRRGSGERAYRDGLARCPSVADALAGAGPPARVLGARDLPTYFRIAAGPGWALVGDAAHHKDPLAARGIADALLGAERLACHVLAGWDRDLEGALVRYRADLMRLLEPTADLNDRLAHLDLPPEQARHTWRALRATEAALSASDTLEGEA